MPYVKSFDGSKIFYKVIGKGNPIIFLACVGAQLAFWKYQEPLATKYKLILIDVAGTGRSEKKRENYAYESLAKDVCAVIKKEQLKKTILIGHSFGGIIALEAAKMLQNTIQGIISIDSMLPSSVYYARKATNEEITEVMKDYEGDYKEKYDSILYRIMGDRLNSQLKEWVISIAGYEQTNPLILKNMVLNMLLHNYYDIKMQVKCPIKYILNGLYSLEYLNAVLMEQRDAHVIEGGGHFANIEAPERFNKIIEGLVKEIIEEKKKIE